MGGLERALPADEGENRVTDPENPFLLAKSRVVLSDPPGGAVSKVFTAVMVKSGPVTATVRYALCVRLHPLVPPTVTV